MSPADDETLEKDATLSGSDAEAPPALVAEWLPVVARSVYRVTGEIGHGGGGRIMRAFDQRLGRWVALKLPINRNGAAEQRFRNEARVTARLEHPGIVPVYDVGRWSNGQVFYAMRLVSGQSLAEVLAQRPSLDERLPLLPQLVAVADAMAYAHSQQVIHRDLKPSNIMLGSFGEALVIDWGLAKDLRAAEGELPHEGVGIASPDATSTDTVLGTPAYMAPEQAMSPAVDARADVYSLGAVLYGLLTGRAPYDETGASEILERLKRDAPVPPQRREPGAPEELVAIVDKAMRREPGERYAHAGELAAELRRFQTGQLVRAHRYSPLVLLRRWLARHPRVVAAALLAVLLAAAAGFLGRERKAAAARLRLAADLSAKVEREKARLDVDYRSPLHDTRPTIAAVKEQMRGVESALAAGRDSERALGLYALARVHMALREFPEARQELEAAMPLSDHPADVQAALGRTLAELYGLALHELITLPSPLRAERAKALQQSLRDPAVQLLKREASSTLVRGIIARFEERFDEALALAGKAAAQEPTGYEALLLQGDVEVARAQKEQLSGHRAEALAGLERAGAAYRSAAEIGRSDPFVHQRECQRIGLVVLIQLETSTIEPKVADDALAACERARHADPDLASVLLDEARVYEHLSESDAGHGTDPQANVQRGAALVKEALRLDPAIPDGEMRIAGTLVNQATWQLAHAIDPRPTFALMRADLEAAIKRRPTAEAYHTLGGTYTNEADYLLSLGQDPTAQLEKGIEMAERALQLDDRAVTHYNIGTSHIFLASWDLEHGRNPKAHLAQARKQLETVLAMKPNLSEVYQWIARAQRLEASFEWENGRDAHALFEEALANGGRGLIRDQEVSSMQLERATTLCVYAESLIDEGKDAAGQLVEGRAAIDKSLAADSDNSVGYQRLAEIEILRARSSRSPAASFAEAERALAKAEHKNPTDLSLMQTRGVLARRKAQWQLASGGDASATVAMGLKSIDRAITAMPNDALLAAVRGVLEAQGGRITRDPGRRAAALERAHSSLERALRINPLLARRYRPLLDEVPAAAAR